MSIEFKLKLRYTKSFLTKKFIYASKRSARDGYREISSRTRWHSSAPYLVEVLASDGSGKREGWAIVEFFLGGFSVLNKHNRDFETSGIGNFYLIDVNDKTKQMIYATHIKQIDLMIEGFDTASVADKKHADDYRRRKKAQTFEATMERFGL